MGKILWFLIGALFGHSCVPSTSMAQTTYQLVAPNMQIAAAVKSPHALPPGLPQGAHNGASVKLSNAPTQETPNAIWAHQGKDRFTGADKWKYASACTVIRKWIPISADIDRCDFIAMSDGGIGRISFHTTLLSGRSDVRLPSVHAPQ